MVRRGRPRLPHTGDVGVDGRARAERGGLLQGATDGGRETERPLKAVVQSECSVQKPLRASALHVFNDRVKQDRCVKPAAGSQC